MAMAALEYFGRAWVRVLGLLDFEYVGRVLAVSVTGRTATVVIIVLIIRTPQKGSLFGDEGFGVLGIWRLAVWGFRFARFIAGSLCRINYWSR